MALKTPGYLELRRQLSSLTSNSASQLDILSHDGNSLGVDCSQIGVLKKTDQVSLSSLLEGKDGARLESEISLEILSDLPNESLEWKLSDKKISALLVAPDFS